MILDSIVRDIGSGRIVEHGVHDDLSLQEGFRILDSKAGTLGFKL